jgi:hypothetical protein
MKKSSKITIICVMASRNAGTDEATVAVEAAAKEMNGCSNP